MILHITTLKQWHFAQTLGKYQTDSLTKEGFIHCSTLNQVLAIANTFYQTETDLILLFIDPEKLHAEIKWEPPSHPHPNIALPDCNLQQFPHVYGAINLDAVTKILPLVKDKDNLFTLPKNWV